MRLAWLVLPAAVGFGLSTTFDHLSEGRSMGIELWWWLAWFAGMVATLVPHPLSLTVIRVLAAASVLACVTGGLVGEWELVLWVSLAWSVLVTVLAFSPAVGDLMVNGSAYGSERRMALRPPGYALVFAVPLTGLAMVAALLAPPLLLASSWPWAAAVALVVAVPVLWAGGRLLYQLARRWIVFVPAGFVIHDPVSLVEPVLMRRSSISTLGPALDQPDRQVTDLSGAALGLALEVAMTEPTGMSVRGGAREAAVAEPTNVIFTPSLPGALLAEARVRGIHIGTAAPEAV